MNRRIIAQLGIVGVLTALASASVATVARAQTSADSSAIRQAALDFEEGWYEGDAARMARALHPDFRMRHVRRDPATGRSVLDQDWTAHDLIEYTRAGRGEVPPAKRRHDITILDIFNDAASAKIVAWYGVDYLQLAKWNSHWVIMHVLWGENPSLADRR